jgi:4-hydroxy-tetrahydrodipicolinate reductase
MVVRVGVFGAAGRMGRAVCEAVNNDPNFELVAAIDPLHVGLDLRQAIGLDIPGVQITGSPEAMALANADVAIDFTAAAAARDNLHWCALHGIHAVVGTTGLGDEDFDALRTWFLDGPDTPNCVVAPNFAIGAVLMMRFAELAAPFFDTAEVIEFHHDQKVDAPSGTAVATAGRLAEASSNWAPDPTEYEVFPGARGGKGPLDIRVHAVRMRGMVAHQEVILGTSGQTLTVRHDSYDRTSFMPGVLLAASKVASLPGLTIGLDTLLFDS